jgi:phage terminase large subunit
MPQLKIPSVFGFLRKPARFKVAYGGRGGAKSWTFARVLIAKAAEEKKRILCTRELQLSIRDSVHRILSDQIEAAGYSDQFAVTHQEIRCTRTGSEFIFAGLRSNPAKIKSTEGIDICWVEEAEVVSEESWKFLIPTIRKPDSEIWVSFNPYQPTDPTYRRFVISPPEGAIVVKVGWEDNHWFPDVLKKDMEQDYRVDPDAAAHIWGGETLTISKAQILYGKIHVEPFEISEEFNGPYFGADWGFANDPTTLVKCFALEKKGAKELYVSEEAYGVGVEVVDTPELFDSVGGARKHTIRADSARPETISHLAQNGYPRIIAAAKGPGSVEDGIMHLRSFDRIVIHPRCKHAITEGRLWQWQTDKLSGDILPKPIDKHNHIWDAVRYALEPVMTRSKIVVSPNTETNHDGWGL